MEENVKDRELQSFSAFSPSLPPFDLSLWDSSSPILCKAQGQHSKKDVEGVGRAIELGVSRRAKGRQGAAAPGLLQQS